MTTAAWPVQVAVASALEADAPLVALLGSWGGSPAIYSGQAPEGAPFDRVILGEPAERDFDALMRRGNEGTLLLDVYTLSPANAAALAIYGRLVAALDAVPLALTGHALLTGRVSLVTAFGDPDSGGRHLVARYRALTRSTT